MRRVRRARRSQSGLCALCLASIDKADPFELQAHLAKLTSADESQLTAVHAIWRFDVGGAFQQAHHRLKYGGQPRVGYGLGVALGEHVSGLGTWDAVVCVGQSRARYFERGYNQAEPIARGVAEATSVPFVPDLLHKEAGHASQTRLSRSARSANAAHAFAPTHESTAHACCSSTTCSRPARRWSLGPMRWSMPEPRVSTAPCWRGRVEPGVTSARLAVRRRAVPTRCMTPLVRVQIVALIALMGLVIYSQTRGPESVDGALG